VPFRELAGLLDQVSAIQVVLAEGPAPSVIRPAWVAVRVAPADALATERAGGVSAVERTVAAVALKAVRTLEAAGWACRAVPPDGLVPVLVEATGLDAPPQEHWSYWRCGRAVRTHYAVNGWTPGHGMIADGVSQLAVRLRRGGGDPVGQAAVLAVVAAPPATLGRVCRAVVAAAAVQGIRLDRLDGEQAPAAYASAPTAAGR
jgi:type VII secretion protein EccE